MDQTSTSPSSEGLCIGIPYKGPAMECFWRGPKRSGDGRLVVVGHRGCGKNRKPRPSSSSSSSSFITLDGNNVCLIVSSSLPLSLIMENTVTSFNAAGLQGADFVEFDVQVTMDGCPVVFHDDLIVVESEGKVVASAISELSLQEFRSIGYQGNASKTGKTLLRQAVDGSFALWTAPIQDRLCTLQDVFEQTSPAIGFNIELKFHDTNDVPEAEIHRVINATLSVVEKCGSGRRIYFSSFHPDAVQVLRKQQSAYPVLFLTDGGVNTYTDPRRNSLDQAIEVCREGGLQGIVSEVRAILGKPEIVASIHEAGLSILTYGDMNNLAEVVHRQEESGVDGVIVDNVADMVRVNRALDTARHHQQQQQQQHDLVLPNDVPLLAPLALKAVRA